MQKKNDVKILFLAKYAPVLGVNYLLEKDSSIKLLVGYHKEIYDILSNCYSVVSSNEIGDVIKYYKEIDYVFSIYNAATFRNPEIFVSSICEYLNLPYLGAPPNIRALAEDKHIAKMTALYAGIPTAKWITWDFNRPFDVNYIKFEGPYFVKPRYGAASKYISEKSIIFTKNDLYDRVEFLRNLKVDVIIEEYIPGVYHTVPAYSENGKVKLLPCLKENTPGTANIITYEQRTYLEKLIPPIIVNDEDIIDSLNKYTKRMFRLIEPLDFARFDYIISDKDAKPYFLEVNICCSLGSYAEFAIAAKYKGIEYEEMIIMLLKNSLFRQTIFGG